MTQLSNPQFYSKQSTARRAVSDGCACVPHDSGRRATNVDLVAQTFALKVGLVFLNATISLSAEPRCKSMLLDRSISSEKNSP